jgi:hypothetical protein
MKQRKFDSGFIENRHQRKKDLDLEALNVDCTVFLVL